MSGGGSNGKNYYGFGKGKGGRKGDPIIWEGPLCNIPVFIMIKGEC